MKRTSTVAALLIIVLAIIAFERLAVDGTTTVRESIAVQSNATQRAESKEKAYPQAAELVEPDAYINAEPFKLRDYIGKKVILVDFWTYSCINCQRTLPYLTQWHKEYEDDGLLIVGVHTPEFAFEKELSNVQRAVDKYSIEYPVVLDNDYKTWRAYQNRYWPRKYLIDIDGFIVYDHIGEGAYEETEEKIRELLRERSEVLGVQEEVEGNVQAVEQSTNLARTPEIYFGYRFSRGQLGNGEGWQPDRSVQYALPSEREVNKFYLEGSWMNNEENMQLVGEQGKVVLRYFASQVNVVAGADGPRTLTVHVDGKPVQNVTVREHDLYTLVDSEYNLHELVITAEQGTRLYTFTFG